MVQSDLILQRRRAAWFILLSGFSVFLLICLSIPVLATQLVRTSRRPMTTSITANQGTVALIASNGDSAALLAAEPPRELDQGTELLTNAADTALFSAISPTSNLLLMRGQLYGNTRVEVIEATSPRFNVSSLPYNMTLSISNGRMRVSKTDSQERDFVLQINTPQGEFLLSEAGEYSIEVNNEESQINVLSGSATLIGGDENQFSMTLVTDERGRLLYDQPPVGPLTSSRNLVQNSNFREELIDWTEQPWNIELTDQPAGETMLVQLLGEQTLRFSRTGIGHADVGVRQVIDQDVTDFSSLSLITSFRINTQSLGVCGTVGSECPLTIRVVYQDVYGANLTWEQGYYANGTIAADTPDICTSCAPPYNPHKFVLPGRVYVEEVDILSSLADQGFSPPSRIDSITVIAAGHTFETDLLSVSLIGRE